MLSFKIDPATDDIIFENGRLVMIEGGLEDSQSIWLRLRTWETEWYFDRARGIPYERYWKKGFPLQMIYSDILRELFNDPRIEQVVRLELEDVSPKDRSLTVHMEARMVNGDLLESTRVVRA